MDTTFDNSGEQPPAEIANQQASVWMKRGIALLKESTPVHWQEAIGYFDQAIELRSGLPLEANPFFRYGLAAGWMNRADAFTRLGSPDNLTEAMRSYDNGLETLRGLSLDTNPLFRRRLAIAWQNRGLTLQAQNTDPSLVEADRSFEMAITTLEHEGGAAISDRDYLLTAAWMNRANARFLGNAKDSAVHARKAAIQALAAAVKTEAVDLATAEISLKARHILCRVIAELLAQNEAMDSSKDGLFAEATDAVESGLALVRVWELKGDVQLRPLAQELFRFGTRAYQIFQPHFLNEFLLDLSAH